MAEQNTSSNQVEFAKSYTHIQRIKDIPKLILNHQVGHRYEFFRFKMSSGKDECTLILILYPGGYDYDYDDHVAIRASVDREIDYKIIVNIAICGRENEERFKRRLVLSKENYDREVVKDFVDKSVLLNTVDLLRNNNLLKIICQASFDYNADKLLQCRNAQMDNYERLFDNGDFSDFKLIVDDTTFNVHKCILATHSPVFAAMFRNEMTERSQSATNVQDIDVEVMKELLRFIYVGRVDKIDELASNLWIAADKYDLSMLKELCEQKLIDQLSIDIICETLCFLDKFNATRLKQATIRRIIDNADELSKDHKFKSTIKTLSSDFLAEVLCASLTRSNIHS